MPGIRLARPDEADTLTALCVRSKAMWGYDAAFMARTRAALTVTAAEIASGGVWVAEDGDGIVGMAAIEAPDQTGRALLDKLFIEPERTGHGVGQALMTAICNVAKASGATVVRLLADPNAAPFYERWGAKRVGEESSATFPGRMLPAFEIDLLDRDRT